MRILPSRRHLLFGSAGLLEAAGPPKTVAAIITMYTDDQRLKSHASVICGRILEGYRPNDKKVEPRTRIVSMYTHQVPENDLSRGLAAKHGFRICDTVDQAITNGTDRLAVDAVLFVGEHGNYPVNAKGQKLYPRYELFEQIAQTFRRVRKSAPVFCDKHLSYSWEKARRMYDWSRELKFPLMAGSSIPVTVRTPELEIPYGARIEHAVAVGYGDNDAYGFHTLETLQCMVERRARGESGIAAVRFVEGDEVWKWRDSDAGRWSGPLLDAALATNPKTRPGRMEDNVKRPALFIIEYRDGMHAAAYMLQGHANNFLFATRLRDEKAVRAANFGLPEGGRPLAHFDGLVHCIEEMFVTGRPVYPVERTLLTTGALALLFDSRGGGRRETPELRIRYRAPRNTWFQRS